MANRKFKAAAVQTLAKLGDIDANIEIARGYVEEAVRQGVELIVFPECMDTGYLFDDAEHCRSLAGPVPHGKFISALAGMAKQHGIYIASGITELDEQKDKIFNSGILLDRKGELACHYHKQFLATHDQNWFSFGERGCPVVDTDLGRIGLLICFDGRIPEIFRSMALQGAEIIIDMANFFAMDQADMWGPARSYENGLWLVAATKSGYERSIYYPGGSMIVDPRGNVLSKVAHDTHGMAVFEVDPGMARDKSIYTANDKLADRRPETYAAMALPYHDTPVSKMADTPMVPSKMIAKVAAVQMHVGPEITAKSIWDMVDHAAKLGVKVITLPEYAFSAAWAPDEGEAARLAEQYDDLVASAGRIAARYECVIALPTVRAENGKKFVSTSLTGPTGGVVGIYDKTHLTAEERAWATPGDAYPVFETPFGNIGIMSGYDALFPETSRCLAIMGAEIILWPASMREAYERNYVAVPRAEDNRVALVLANRLDSPFPGGSMVVPATGFPDWDINKMVPRNLHMGAVMPKHIDLAVCRQKQMIPKVDMFRNRMPETYGAIVAARA